MYKEKLVENMWPYLGKGGLRWITKKRVLGLS